tara:strand:+ start:8814 stop:9500 length:687 start_codon:yes stop_codon:yes gene_type:complete
MAVNYLKRIAVDIIELEKDPLDNIFIHYDDDDITTIYALIIGPKDTPYENGFYYFTLIFPTNYPSSPPTCKFNTINNKIRFNPNLYENGKICLSILGTWSGPSWKPVMGLKSILLDFQSLLHEYPIINEPMYNKLNIKDIKSINYNKILTYHNYSFAILEMYKKTDYFPFFRQHVNKHFKENYTNIIHKLIELEKTNNNLYIEVFPWKCSSSKLDYTKLIQNYKNIEI